MDVGELESILKLKLGPHIKFIGIYTSDRLPVISYNAKPIVLIANTLKSSANINTVGHWFRFYLEFYLKKRVMFLTVMGSHHTFMLIVDFLHFLTNIGVYFTFPFTSSTTTFRTRPIRGVQGRLVG